MDDPQKPADTKLNNVSVGLPSAPVSPPPPIPLTKKEGEPQAMQIAKEEGSPRGEAGDDYWENYAREIEIEKEIAEMGGVEKVASGEVKIPEDVAKEMGVRPTVEIQTPIAKISDFSIGGTSLSDDQLSSGLTKPTSSGLRWLVEWFIYQLLKAHYFVKKVKGKVIRAKA